MCELLVMILTRGADKSLSLILPKILVSSALVSSCLTTLKFTIAHNAIPSSPPLDSKVSEIVPKWSPTQPSTAVLDGVFRLNMRATSMLKTLCLSVHVLLVLTSFLQRMWQLTTFLLEMWNREKSLLDLISLTKNPASVFVRTLSQIQVVRTSFWQTQLLLVVSSLASLLLDMIAVKLTIR